MMLDLRRNTDFDCRDSVIMNDGPEHSGGGVNRSELIDAVASEMALTKREAEAAVGAVIGNIVDEVRSGRRVSLVGFGSFNPTKRAARTGRNPQTGEPVAIAASRGVRFQASSTLKDIVNGKAEPAARKAVTSVPAKSTATKSTARKTTARKTAARKTTAKKTAARKTAARKTTAKRAPARKSTARKTTARKTTARKTAAKKTGARKTAARKTTAKKAGARKTATKRAPARKTAAKRAPARKVAKRATAKR
jgi:DNA-binding protein HU-beta